MKEIKPLSEEEINRLEHYTKDIKKLFFVLFFIFICLTIKGLLK